MRMWRSYICGFIAEVRHRAAQWRWRRAIRQVVGDGKNFWPKTAQDTDALLHRYPLQGDALRVTCRLAEIQEAGIQELARRGK